MLRLKYAFILMFFVYCIGLLAGYLVFQYIDFQMPPGVVSSFGFVDFLTDKQRLLLNIIVHNLVVSLKIVLLGCFSLGILGGCILQWSSTWSLLFCCLAKLGACRLCVSLITSFFGANGTSNECSFRNASFL